MPLKGKPQQEDPAARKAAETFERLAQAQPKDFGSLPQTTEPLSFRVPKGEKARIRAVFARNGMKLSEGMKKAVYSFLEELEGKR